SSAVDRAGQHGVEEGGCRGCEGCVTYDSREPLTFNGVPGNLGNLYGTTLRGGAHGSPSGEDVGDGVVFELTPQPDGSWTETVLHSFGDGTDGINPSAGLVLDHAGNLYGTTVGGGAGGSSCSGGCGTVFEVSPGPNGQWTETLLYNFCSQANCTDGNAPAAGLIFDSAGNLYGTTTTGGDSAYGDGTVFELTPGENGQWSETVLYMFQNFQDGSDPSAGLILDKSGTLYGTTIYGGDGNSGTVFELSPNPGNPWVERVIYRFFEVQNGGQPYAGLVFDKAGNLWGTTGGGGVSFTGVIFELTPGGVEALSYSVSLFGGCYPYAGLILGADGNLYGTTSYCGTNYQGIVFEATP
ncbi:MAG: choice-of-anchor tandem repeat GloVer-containing protein, partial [Terriglobales bacterium]